VSRPVSVPVMLMVLSAAASRDPVRMGLAESLLLRAAFPRPRWCWWTDPVRALVRGPIDLRRAVVARLTRIPQDAPARVEDDPLAATRAWQRAAVRPVDLDVPRPTLLLAAQACRAMFGNDWYFNPTQWRTSDGYVPFDVCWTEFAGLSALEARAQLVQVQAHAVAHSGKQSRGAVDALIRTVYPMDPLNRRMVS